MLLALAAPACGGDEGASSAPRSQPDGDAPHPASPPEPEATCPTGLANCRSASGRVVYVERVDPDGDGDAHFVLFSRESVSAPGISIIDVRRDLRPKPLPGIGARISAAGPVYRGSHGQRQIEAVAVRVHRR